MKFSINKQKLIEEGAIGKVWKAYADNHEMKAQNAKLNWKENKFQYLLNPYVSGPLSHLSNSVKSGFYKFLTKIFFTGEKVESIADLEKRVKSFGSTPFSREMQILIEDMKKMPEINKNIMDEHFIQWLLNPLVPGPIGYFKHKKDIKNLNKKK